MYYQYHNKGNLPKRPTYYLKLNLVQSFYFKQKLLETFIWTLSEGFNFTSLCFNLPNQLSKSTLCKMILLVALATNPCRIL